MPLIAAGPDVANGGREVTALVAAVDLYATAVELASVEPVSVVLGGPHADLNEQVWIDGLRSAERDRLPGLEVVYVSAEPPGAKLRRTRRASGGTRE